MMLSRLWNDTAALAERVGKIISEANDEAEYEFYNLRWDTHPGIPMSEILDSIEHDAVMAAEAGNFIPLGDLVERKNPLFGDFKSVDWDLKPATKALIAQRLRGEHKVPRGKPRQTADQRRANNPIHDAAAEVPLILNILRQHFPGRRGYRDRAIDIAAHRIGLKRDRLAKHMESKHLLTPT
jgi:hypothetical protein